MPRLRGTLLAFLLLVALGFQIQADLTPARNDVALAMNDPALAGLRIAVLSDLHLSADQEALARMVQLLEEVNAAKPDLIALLGDYISHPDALKDKNTHRDAVAGVLAALRGVPVVAVLGNYESWDDRQAWAHTLRQQGIIVLENDAARLKVSGRLLCVRGIGDAFTGHHRETPFPRDCDGRGKVTLTHDPFAAFALNLDGLVLAGHTHCGQLRIPGLGPIWVPSDAPREAICGEYKEAGLFLWVTSGLGESILPVRLFAPSSWDLLTIFESGPHST